MLPPEDDLLLRDIPPCSLVTVTLPTSTYWDSLGAKYPNWLVDFEVDHLSFAENSRRWRKTSSSLVEDARLAQPTRAKASNGTPRDRAYILLSRRIFLTSVKENPASDCSGDA